MAVSITCYFFNLNSVFYYKIQRSNIKMVKDKWISKGERECKRALEEIFGKPFLTVNPKFLYCKLYNKNLEIDCFNSEIKNPLGGFGIAVEYDGRQHFEFTPKFHKTQKDFKRQKAIDEFKNIRCAENKVTLIRVPYTVITHHIRDYLIFKLYEKGFTPDILLVKPLLFRIQDCILSPRSLPTKRFLSCE